MKMLYSTKGRKAFTLVELLVVITIIGLLAALIVPAVSTVRRSADRTEALSDMRQVGMAIQLFAADNDNTLPGPLWGGQSAWYNSGDSRTLGYQLWSYLGGTDPKAGGTYKINVLAPKAYQRVLGANSGCPSVITDQTVTVNGVTYNPWGYQGTSDPSPISQPMKISTAATAGLTKMWALQDIDKTSPNANANQGWYSQLPATPLYSPYRLNLFFDLHAEAIRIP